MEGEKENLVRQIFFSQIFRLVEQLISFILINETKKLNLRS